MQFDDTQVPLFVNVTNDHWLKRTSSNPLASPREACTLEIINQVIRSDWHMNCGQYW